MQDKIFSLVQLKISRIIKDNKTNFPIRYKLKFLNFIIRNIQIKRFNVVEYTKKV